MGKFVKKINYNLLCFANSLCKKKEKYIFIYDSQFMRQNCWSLYKYLIDNNLHKKYKIVYYVKCKTPIQTIGEKYKKNISHSIIKSWIWCIKSKYTFYEYHNNFFNCKPNKGQKSVYLTHGMPLKNYGYAVETPVHPYENDYTFLLMTSSYYIPIMKKILGCSEKQIYLGGMPRCDMLLNSKHIDKFIKVESLNFLWMPTFRSSKTNGIQDSSSNFPILNKNNIEELNNVLINNNINLIIKPHPFQDKIEWLYNSNFSNIKIVFNSDLLRENIELYELVNSVDCLLTDYSSIYSDFLLKQKPIVFVVDDLNEYKEHRGFVDDDLYNILPGPMIDNFPDFLKVFSNYETIVDSYAEALLNAQRKLMPLPKSDCFSKDLCDFLGIGGDD